MRVLVTGSSGFIGRHVVDALLARGDEVVRHDPADRDYKLWDLEPWEAALTEFTIDGIIHLGAITDTLVHDSAALIACNVDFPKLLFTTASHGGIPFVYASSASVYGQGVHGFHETSQAHPLNAYAGSKLAFDRWATSRLVHVPPTWAGLRFFNVYGPAEEMKGRMASMVSKCVWAKERDVEIALFRWGEQRRDFVAVHDVVNVALWALNDLDEPYSGIYNVGSGRATSFAEVAEVVGPRVAWVPMPTELRDVYQYYTCAPLARLRHAGYHKPFMTVGEGLAQYRAERYRASMALA